jgi:pyruvate,orthophosphate dikinase
MFMAADRQPKMQAMILASSPAARRTALGELLPLQQSDFEGLFAAMAGLPVTIRLLDPPLHEFLPDATDLAVELDRARRERPDDVARLELVLERVRELEETNPMLGTRGARLGIIAPEIYDVQVEAIIAAARAIQQRAGAAPRVEIMIPLVAYEEEVALLRDRVERVIAAQHAGDLDVLIGTMIELPRACFIANEIARVADFFSFGTNDLTQTALGFSRDDVESGFLSHYLEQRIIDRSPFETIDQKGVGWLVRLAAWIGRETRPDLKLGICGEHGGDPESIRFFDMAGLDYVSCSPYRVPIARVAAAQAAITPLPTDGGAAR